MQPDPIVIRSDLNAPSSCEWAWIALPALSVQSSPMETSVFSTSSQPSSKTRRPIRTPSNRQITFLNGVPLKTWTPDIAAIFQNRSCRQNAMS